MIGEEDSSDPLVVTSTEVIALHSLKCLARIVGLRSKRMTLREETF